MENNRENNLSSDDILDTLPENTYLISEKDFKQKKSNKKYKLNTINILSINLGIFSIVLSCLVFPAIISSILGIICSIYSISKNPQNKNIPILSIIISLIGLAFSTLILLMALMFNQIFA